MQAQGCVLIMYEVARPLSNNLKGDYHINYPSRYVSIGRVCVVTHRLRQFGVKSLLVTKFKNILMNKDLPQEVLIAKGFR